MPLLAALMTCGADDDGDSSNAVFPETGDFSELIRANVYADLFADTGYVHAKGRSLFGYVGLRKGSPSA